MVQNGCFRRRRDGGARRMHLNLLRGELTCAAHVAHVAHDTRATSLHPTHTHTHTIGQATAVGLSSIVSSYRTGSTMPYMAFHKRPVEQYRFHIRVSHSTTNDVARHTQLALRSLYLLIVLHMNLIEMSIFTCKLAISERPARRHTMLAGGFASAIQRSTNESLPSSRSMCGVPIICIDGASEIVQKQWHFGKTVEYSR